MPVGIGKIFCGPFAGRRFTAKWSRGRARSPTESASQARQRSTAARHRDGHGLVEGTICIIFPLADWLRQLRYMVAGPVEVCVYWTVIGTG